MKKVIKKLGFVLCNFCLLFILNPRNVSFLFFGEPTFPLDE